MDNLHHSSDKYMKLIQWDVVRVVQELKLQCPGAKTMADAVQEPVIK